MKKTLIVVCSVLIALLVADLLTGAQFSNSYGKQDVRIYGTITGTGYVRDTSAFSGALMTKAIYIAGATAGDIYVVTRRTALGVSTAASTDSCVVTYMAKTDSLIVIRNNGLTPGLKFSYVRFK